MSDTLYNGLNLPLITEEPETPEDGFVLYAIGDKVFAKFPDGAVKELTNV